MAEAESEGDVKREDVEQSDLPEEEEERGGDEGGVGDQPEGGAEGEDGLETSGDAGVETEEVPQPAEDDGGELGSTAAAAEGVSERVEQIPDTGEVAEIVLVTTSLGSIRRQFFSSQRTKNFLDCKGVVYIIVDSNRDTSTAKNLRDVELFKEWKDNRILKATPETEDSADPESTSVAAAATVTPFPTTPSVITPSANLETTAATAETEILETSGCLHEKPLSAEQCNSCGVVFKPLIPPNYITDGHVLQMLQGCPYNEEEGAGEGEGEHPQQQRWGFTSQQSLVADVDFGDFDDSANAAAAPADSAPSALEAAVKAEAEAEAAVRRASGEQLAAAVEGDAAE